MVEVKAPASGTSEFWLRCILSGWYSPVCVLTSVSGGDGENAWQHAQVAREDFDEDNPPATADKCPFRLQLTWTADSEPTSHSPAKPSAAMVCCTVWAGVGRRAECSC